MRLQPRNGMCFVRIQEQRETKTATGIVVPASQGTMFDTAVLLAVGPGIWDFGHQIGTSDLKVGDTVLIKSGMRGGAIGEQMRTLAEFDMDGGKVCLINQQDILAVIQPLEQTTEPATSPITVDGGTHG